MFKFIFYFVFFGLLFYGLHVYAPDTFNVLQSAAASVYNFVIHLVDSFLPAKATAIPPVVK